MRGMDIFMLFIEQKDFIALTEYIHTNYGINLSHKKNLIEGRLTNTIIEKGFNSFSEYLKYVFADKSGKEATILINKLTTNHTFFMREANHFNYFKDKVIPYLSQNVKSRDLRIWSAGCSTGEEPYTLAMILQEYFGDQKSLWDTKVLATDISVRALETAEHAIYSRECIGSIPAIWKLQYFDKLNDEHYKINDKIRNEVIFRVFNLMDEVFPFKKRFHTIFCRNVMIYFDQKTKTELVRKFYKLTEPGGYLFIGHSESIPKEATAYRYIMPAVFRKEPV